MGKPKKAANGKQKVEGMKMKGKSTPTSSSKSSVAAGTSRRSSSQIGKTKEEGKSTPTSSSKSSVSVVAGTSRRSSSLIQTPEPPRFKALQEANGKDIKSYQQPFKNPKVLKLTIQRPNKKKEEGKKKEEKMATRAAVAEPQPSPEPVVDLVEQMQALEEEEEEYLSSPSSVHSEEEVDLFRSDMLQVNYKSHPKLIEHMVKSSLMSPAFSDILLCAENEIFHCHKLILAAASEHLARLMERMTTVGSQQVIMMSGMKAQVLKKILEFIYKGSVLVAQENLGDFIKAGTDLKIQGLYCKEVTPSTSKTSLEGGGGRKAEEGMWFGGRSADLGFIPPPLAPHCVTTQMDEVLFPVPPNDSRTNTASSDNSDDDEDDDDFKPPRKKRATFGSSGNEDSVLKSPESSINSPQQQGTATPKPEAGKIFKKKAKKEEKVTAGLVKGSKSKEKGREDIINTRAEDIINELTGLGGLWTMPTFLGTTAIPKVPSAPVASTSGTSKAAKKRPDTAISDSNSSEEPVAPAPPPPGAKRPKRVDAAVSTRLSTEEKEKNEEKMQAAIKMAMETHNVVKSATTHGVATSTLRGRLKKLGYSTPARPPTKITAELVQVATKKAET